MIFKGVDDIFEKISVYLIALGFEILIDRDEQQVGLESDGKIVAKGFKFIENFV